MWVLMLNDMRDDHYEHLTPQFRADAPQELLALLERERVPSYRDGQWGKNFRAGGPLEWCNPPLSGPTRENLVNAGTREGWMEREGSRYDAEVMSIPLALSAPPAGGEPVVVPRAPAAGP